jgi:hypothetical protein
LSGYFQHPDLLKAAQSASKPPTQYILEDPGVYSRCVPCNCNRHGEHCDPVNGEECECADDTFSDLAKCRSRDFGSCWHVQCATCLSSISLPSGTLSLDGDPTNGRFCFAVPKLGVSASVSVAPGATGQFVLVPTFTNVDLHLVVERDMADDGDLSVLITTSNNLTWDVVTGALLVPPATSRPVRSRVRVTIASADYNFVTQRFYVTVLNSGQGQARFNFVYTQPIVSINLTVFFSVFFSAFYLFLAGLIVVAKWKQEREERQQSQQVQVQLEVSGQPGVGGVRWEEGGLPGHEERNGGGVFPRKWRTGPWHRFTFCWSHRWYVERRPWKWCVPSAKAASLQRP